MKNLFISTFLCTTTLCVAQTNTVPVAASSVKPVLAFDAGADFRIRQEIMHNVPGLPGAPMAMMPQAYKEMQNHIRYRPRVWTRLDSDVFTLYGRLVDEMREYPVKNGKKRKDRNYNFPDEVILDNLYLEGRGLFDGFMDFKIGRQDLLDGPNSVFGLPRLLQDGTPYDGSRSCYADMIKFAFHTSEDSKIDVFALYDSSRNDVGWSTHQSRARPLTAYNPRDSADMDEWGGGIIWNDKLLNGSLPYQIYAIHKHCESYTQYTGNRVPDKQITTVGVHLMPEVTENLSFDFDAAQQFGSRSNGTQAGGTMGYAAIDFHKEKSYQGIRPYTRLSAYYLSGDRHRNGNDDNDTAWDPMWARAPQDSELVQYGNLYGLGYWSNILYTKWTIGAEFSKRHAICAYSGPMWAATQDRMGHADGSGESMFKGILSAIRYDFPILLAPKGAKGTDRFEIFGHLLAEVFNPGDYYDSSRPSYFLRWEFTFKF